MSVLVAGSNLGLGLAYLGLALMALTEIAAQKDERGVSRFGLAYVAMALSCGPHHLINGIQAIEGYNFNWIMTVTSLLGVPAGLGFVALRVEAMRGGPGDRIIRGRPGWLILTVCGFWFACGGLTVASIYMGVHNGTIAAVTLVPNLFVTVTYGAVGFLLARHQMRRNLRQGTWSLSGLSLTAIFPTCALMHLTFGLTASASIATCPTDFLGIPASLYFLWIVNQLYQQAFSDWNRKPLAGIARRTARVGPWGPELKAET